MKTITQMLHDLTGSALQKMLFVALPCIVIKSSRVWTCKAFDRVPHECLLKKIEHHCIQANTLKWIRAFLTDRSQQVIIERTTSDSVQLVSSIPQGTVLEPLFFLIFINDLPDSVQSSTGLCIVSGTPFKLL